MNDTHEPILENSSCPSAEALAAYADLSLTGAARRTLRQHLRGCTDCSRAVLAMQRALAPIRDRHRGGGGWRGPLESASDTLPDELQPAWTEHLKHCARCSQRTGLLRYRGPILTAGGTGLVVGALAAVTLFSAKPSPRPVVVLAPTSLPAPSAPAPRPTATPQPPRLPLARREALPDVPPPNWEALRNPRYRGTTTALTPLALRSPVATRVRDNRPTLAWSACPGADRYEVLLVRTDTDELLVQELVTTTTLRCPRALPKGVVFQWEVHALGAAHDELALAQARFEVLNAPGLAKTLSPNRCLELGLREEALKQLQTLPPSEHTNALLHQIQTLGK